MADDPKETFSAGRLLAREKARYLRTLLVGLAPLETPGLGTIGVTEHGVLLVDWDFIAKCTPEEVAGLLVHECLHVCLKHMARARAAGRDMAINNKAADLAINPAVLDMGLRLPGGGPGITVDHPLHGLYPEDFGWPRGLTSDEYYELLRKQEQAGGQGKDGGHKGKGAKGAGGNGKPDAPNDEQGEGGQGSDADHDHAGGGEAKDGDQGDKPHTGGGFCGSCAGRKHPGEPDEGNKASRSQAEMERMKRTVAEAIRETLASPNRGTVPGFMQRWAEEMLKPSTIPWQQKLAMVTRHAVAWASTPADYRYDGPSRRQAGLGFGVGRPVLPRMRLPIPLVDEIIDTSGSMGTQELVDAMSETNAILKATGAKLRLCTCDAAVSGITRIDNIQQAMGALKGGGGTDMRPAFHALEKERPRPNVIVCITDGLVGDGWPTVPPVGVRVILVLVGKYQQIPAGAESWCDIIQIPHTERT